MPMKLVSVQIFVGHLRCQCTGSFYGTFRIHFANGTSVGQLHS